MTKKSTKTRKTDFQGLKPAPLPEAPEPMLCTLVDQPFDDSGWIFEPKYDGLRVMIRFDGKKLTLMSRNGKPQDFQFPDIVEGLKSALRGPSVLDGEIVCLNDEGLPDFKSLQQRFHLQQESVVRSRMKEYPAYLHVFDILYFDRFDVRELPLMRRKSVLEKALRWNDRVRRTPMLENSGTAFFEDTCRARGEGIVAKTKNGRYLASRGSDWVKIKCVLRQEFAVVGFTDPKGSREGLGALLVGYHEKGKLRYAGKVGTGFTWPVLRDLRARLEKTKTRSCPLDEPIEAPGVHWVKPTLVAEISFSEWTRHGALRHPRFVGLREDKSPADVVREKPVEPAQKIRREKPTMKKTPALTKYNKMRDFSKTREPKGKASRAHSKPTFVIQEHHATRLHYDFRLEEAGVLKSWAVTKEPTLDPKIRRLAVEVEDHPLDYASFEGEIPQGQYGGGTVKIWDEGTYENLGDNSLEDAIENGKLKFRLSGRRLKGVFSMIRIHGKGSKPNWLLIKSRDEAARASEPDHGVTRVLKTGRVSAPPSEPRLPRGSLRLIQSGKPGEIELTHIEKIMFPEIGATKGDVLDFYDRIAPWLIPHLRDRPVTIERLPDGLNGERAPHFWQKNTPAYYPAWIPRLQLPSETGKPVNYVLVNDVETLLYLVNQGALTFHVWASRKDDLDHPDSVLFDLDPGEAPFGDVVKLALTLRSILEKRGLESFVKTSGKSGLHVFTKWEEPGDHDVARRFALEVATGLVTAHPDLATTERSRGGRDGRVYVDVMQNARGHHVVPPYVLRAVPEATVSTPLEWKELTAKLDPKQFDLKTIFKRLRRSKEDLMAGLLETRSRVRRKKAA